MPNLRTSKKGLNATERKQTRKIVKRAINSTLETKMFIPGRSTDVEITAATPFLMDMLNISQGITDSTREGDEILFQHLKINLDLAGSVDGLVKTGALVDRMRVILIKWKEPDWVAGTVNEPSLLTLFGVTNLPVGSNIHTAMINHEENGRKFTVLYDRKFTLTGGHGSTDTTNRAGKYKHLSINVPMSKYGHKKVKYNSLDPSVNEHQNGVYLFVLTDTNGTMTFAGPTMSMDARVLFKDT